MKKFAFLFFLFAIGVLCIPQTYAQEYKSSDKEEIHVTFINSTDTEAHLRISEEKTKRPYTYLPIKEMNVSSGQTESTPLSLALNQDKKATLFVQTTGGEGYGETGNNIEVDLNNSNVYAVELTESWVYPGDGFWYIEPFRVIKAKTAK